MWEKTSRGCGVPRRFHVGLSSTGLVTRSARGRSVSACVSLFVPSWRGSGTVSRRVSLLASVSRSWVGPEGRHVQPSLSCVLAAAHYAGQGRATGEEVSLRGGDSGETQPPTGRGWTRRRARWNRGVPRFDVLLLHASGSDVWRCGWAGMVWGTDDMPTACSSFEVGGFAPGIQEVSLVYC